MVPPRALLFDLDGTLIHTAPAIAATLNGLLAEAGLAPLDEATVTGFVGDGAAATIERGFRRHGRTLDAETLGRLAALYARRMAAHRHVAADLYPGVAETVAALASAGHPMAVVTNKPRIAALAALADAGLEALAQGPVVTPDDGRGQKPEAGPVRAALAALGVDPDRTPLRAVLLGDGPADLGAARAAGIPFLAAAWGYGGAGVAGPAADAVLAGMADLPRALAALDRRRA